MMDIRSNGKLCGTSPRDGNSVSPTEGAARSSGPAEETRVHSVCRGSSRSAPISAGLSDSFPPSDGSGSGASPAPGQEECLICKRPCSPEECSGLGCHDECFDSMYGTGESSNVKNKIEAVTHMPWMFVIAGIVLAVLLVAAEKLVSAVAR